MSDILYHEAASGVRLAFRADGVAPSGHGPAGLFWLGGFMSDMDGTKAQALADLAARTGRSSVRFDYSGHGASGGAFRDGTISKWLDEAYEVFTSHAAGPRVVIGSSMGGWIALLLLKQLLEAGGSAARQICGLVLIAPAADMTRDLMWETWDTATRERIERDGLLSEPSDYGDEPYIITRDLITDGRRHLLLGKPFETPCPVRILQGEDDPDVPWEHALKIYHALSGDDISLTLIKAGDHRLSEPGNIAMLQETCLALCERADASAS